MNKILTPICGIYIILNAFLVYHVGHPWESDYSAHGLIVDCWYNGINAMTAPECFYNPFPYPPAFHLTIVGLALMFKTEPLMIFNVLRIIIFPLVLIPTYLVAKKYFDETTATFSILLMATSFGFYDRASQVIPSATDALMLPLCVWAFLEHRHKYFIFFSLFLIYSHFLYGFMFLAPFFIMWVKEREYRTYTIPTIVMLSIPLIMFYFGFFNELVYMGETQERNDIIGQYHWSKTSPKFALAYLGWPLAILTPLVVLNYAEIYRRLRYLTNIEMLLILSVLTMVPFTIIYPHRGLTFIPQALSILCGLYLTTYFERYKEVIYLVLGLVFITVFFTQIHFLGIETSLGYYGRLVYFP